MKTIFKGIGGSFAYGTYIEGKSDLDEKEVYIQPLGEVITKYKPQYENHKDHVAYEVGRFLQLLSTANSSMLEILWLPKDCVLFESDEFKIIKEHRDMFLTKQCKMSYGAYALGQIKKARGLNKKQNWERDKIELKQPIDFCYVVLDKNTCVGNTKQGILSLSKWLSLNRLGDKNVYLNKLNNTAEGYQLYYTKDDRGGILTKDNARLKTISSDVNEIPIATVLYNANAYTQHKRDFDSYQLWLRERNESRYVDFKKHGQSFDGKNLLHCRRLINTAIDIVQQKTLVVRRPEAEELLKIRRGEVDLEDILTQAEEDIIRLDKLFNESDLPEKVDSDIIDYLILKLRGL